MCIGGYVWCCNLVVDVLVDVFGLSLVVIVLLGVGFFVMFWVEVVVDVYLVLFVEYVCELGVFFGQEVGVFEIVFLVFEVDFFVGNILVVVDDDFVVVFVQFL